MQSNNESEFRNRALQCLHNLISAQPDERSIKRELRILKLLEQVRVYTENLLSNFDNGQTTLLDNTGKIAFALLFCNYKILFYRQ